MGDSIKDLFAESVKYDVDKDVFRKRVITFLVEQVAKRLDKPPDDSKYDEIAEKMKEMESKLVEARKDPSIKITMPEIRMPENRPPNIHIDNSPVRSRIKKYKVVRDEDGFIADLEVEEEENVNVNSD